MRIKLDENLPFRLVRILVSLGHETDTVPQEGWPARMTITSGDRHKRSDAFSSRRIWTFRTCRFAPGIHHGLLLVRLRDPGRNALVSRVRSLFQTENVEAWKGCFVVATEHKVRVRSPKQQSDPNKG